MTPETLAALPVGSIVKLDDEEGEVVAAGVIVSIMWPQSKCTNVIDTKAKGWHDFISWLKAE